MVPPRVLRGSELGGEGAIVRHPHMLGQSDGLIPRQSHLAMPGKPVPFRPHQGARHPGIRNQEQGKRRSRRGARLIVGPGLARPDCKPQAQKHKQGSSRTQGHWHSHAERARGPRPWMFFPHHMSPPMPSACPGASPLYLLCYPTLRRRSIGLASYSRLRQSTLTSWMP